MVDNEGSPIAARKALPVRVAEVAGHAGTLNQSASVRLGPHGVSIGLCRALNGLANTSVLDGAPCSVCLAGAVGPSRETSQTSAVSSRISRGRGPECVVHGFRIAADWLASVYNVLVPNPSFQASAGKEASLSGRASDGGPCSFVSGRPAYLEVGLHWALGGWGLALVSDELNWAGAAVLPVFADAQSSVLAGLLCADS